jgi:hypothetical protein
MSRSVRQDNSRAQEREAELATLAAAALAAIVVVVTDPVTAVFHD